jgi:hypothetical protein
VAEFANVRKQLEVLEDRLDEMVLPRLVDALTNRKVYLFIFLLYISSLLTCHFTQVLVQASSYNLLFPFLVLCCFPLGALLSYATY